MDIEHLLIGIIGAAAGAISVGGPVLLLMLKSRKESNRADAEAIQQGWKRHADGLQRTLDHVREELDRCQQQHLEAAEKAAALQERVSVLEELLREKRAQP